MFCFFDNITAIFSTAFVFTVLTSHGCISKDSCLLKRRALMAVPWLVLNFILSHSKLGRLCLPHAATHFIKLRICPFYQASHEFSNKAIRTGLRQFPNTLKFIIPYFLSVKTCIYYVFSINCKIMEITAFSLLPFSHPNFRV